MATYPKILKNIISALPLDKVNVPLGKPGPIKNFFRGTKNIPKRNWSAHLKKYRDIEMASHANKLKRKALRKQLGVNRATAFFNKDYRAEAGKQVKGYLKEVGHDFAHPLQSLKRQWAMTNYHVDPASGKVIGRSPVGKAWTGAMYLGAPVAYSASEFTSKESKGRPMHEKAIRSAAALLPAASPRVIPSLLAYQVPELLYAKKTPKKN
jgi:hypothetical protein